MTVEDLFDQVDVQGEVRIVYVEEDGYERKQLEYQLAKDLDIQYMYVENDIMYIEVEEPEEEQ